MSSTDNTDKIIVPIGPSAPPWPHLVVIAGDDVGRVYRLSRAETTLGRARDVDFQLVARSVSRRHAVVRVDGERVTIQDLGSRNGVFVGVDKIKGPYDIHDGDEVTIGDAILLKLTYSAALEGALRCVGYAAVSRDQATQAMNVPCFIDRLRSELAFGRRHSQPLVIAVIRPDALSVEPVLPNTVVRADIVDEVLRRLVNVLRDTLREEDLLARYGEYVIVLVRTNLAQAEILAERVRLRVGCECAGQANESLPATVTIAVVPLAGWAGIMPETVVVSVLEKAQRAMRGKKDKVILLP